MTLRNLDSFYSSNHPSNHPLLYLFVHPLTLLLISSGDWAPPHVGGDWNSSTDDIANRQPVIINNSRQPVNAVNTFDLHRNNQQAPLPRITPADKPGKLFLP